MTEEPNSEQKQPSEPEEGLWCARCGLDLRPVAGILVTPNGAMSLVPFWCPGCNRPMGEIKMIVKQSPVAVARTLPQGVRRVQ